MQAPVGSVQDGPLQEFGGIPLPPGQPPLCLPCARLGPCVPHPGEPRCEHPAPPPAAAEVPHTPRREGRQASAAFRGRHTGCPRRLQFARAPASQHPVSGEEDPPFLLAAKSRQLLAQQRTDAPLPAGLFHLSRLTMKGMELSDTSITCSGSAQQASQGRTGNRAQPQQSWRQGSRPGQRKAMLPAPKPPPYSLAAPIGLKNEGQPVPESYLASAQQQRGHGNDASRQ